MNGNIHWLRSTTACFLFFGKIDILSPFLFYFMQVLQNPETK